MLPDILLRLSHPDERVITELSDFLMANPSALTVIHWVFVNNLHMIVRLDGLRSRGDVSSIIYETEDLLHWMKLYRGEMYFRISGNLPILSLYGTERDMDFPTWQKLASVATVNEMIRYLQKWGRGYWLHYLLGCNLSVKAIEDWMNVDE